jgi:hypothetical protein
MMWTSTPSVSQDAGDDRLAEQLLPARAVGLAEHDLVDGQLPGRPDHRLGHLAGPPQHRRPELPPEQLRVLLTLPVSPRQAPAEDAVEREVARP